MLLQSGRGSVAGAQGFSSIYAQSMWVVLLKVSDVLKRAASFSAMMSYSSLSYFWMTKTVLLPFEKQVDLEMLTTGFSMSLCVG